MQSSKSGVILGTVIPLDHLVFTAQACGFTVRQECRKIVFLREYEKGQKASFVVSCGGQSWNGIHSTNRKFGTEANFHRALDEILDTYTKLVIFT